MSISRLRLSRREWIADCRAWLALNWPAALWLAVAVVVLVTYLKTIPESYRQAAAFTDIPAEERAEMRRSLESVHLSSTFIAVYEIVAFGIGNVVNILVGWLLIRRAPRTRFAVFLAFVLLALNNAVYPPAIDELLPGQPIAQTIVRLTTVVAIAGFFTMPFIFPDGRFVPRWTVIWGIYNVAGVAIFAFTPSLLPDGSIWAALEAVATVLTVVSIFYAVIYRYRRVSTPVQRRQTRWVMFGLLIGVPGFLAGDALMRNIGASPIGVACLLGFLIVMPVVTLVPAVTVGLAILYHRLFDIDVILSRTLVWLAMTGAVTITYVSVVFGIGRIVESEGNLVVSLIATGLVAVGFQPLRLRVQRVISRLLFGERDNPYAVLSRLGHQIEDSLTSSDLLPAIVRTTAEMLRLPYVAVFLERPGGPVLAAASGIATPATLRLPLIYQGASVGALAVAPRSPGEGFAAADRKLLDDLARQIGVAARTVSLADDLQQSRERIVASREEERRRLRRDLHDGLGAQLAALIMQTGHARSLLRTDPDAADQQLGELRDELRVAVADIRRLVYGLRPPALDELGLAGALRSRLMRLNGTEADDNRPLHVTFESDDPLPALSAAAEVATFRIVEEAIANIVKHARAMRAEVTLRIDRDLLHVTIQDDGIGLPPSGERQDGLGLASMRERAREIGGDVTATTGPEGQGTLVQVSVPIGATQYAGDRGEERT